MMLSRYLIKFTDLSYFVKLGYYPEERKLGQRIYIDFELNINVNNIDSHNIESIFDYSVVSNICDAALNDKEFLFLEEIAEELASTILKDKRLLSVRVKIKKPSVPIDAILKHVELDMEFEQ